MSFCISEKAEETVGNAILVSGSARSGTTIIGKLLHSFEHVEYAFEPPMLFSMMPLITKIPEAQWKLLYETYLYEEFFINALCGRSINCNCCDDSSIYSVKGAEQIKRRLNRSIGKVKAELLGADYTLAFKMPDIVPFVPLLLQYYPHTRVVIMIREAVGTLNSLIAKKWFAVENISANMIWPFRLKQGEKIPDNTCFD